MVRLILVRRSSTLLTRLALALLAVLGFVAPLAAREADGVVQTAGGKPSEVEPREASRAVDTVEHETLPRLELATWAQAPAPVSRRYLLHRAWLL
jgi:hypothetical protein